MCAPSPYLPAGYHATARGKPGGGVAVSSSGAPSADVIGLRQVEEMALQPRRGWIEYPVEAQVRAAIPGCRSSV